MKDKKLLVILVSIALFFVVLFAGASFYLSKKLTPESVRAIVITELGKAFPNAKISLDEIDINIGFTSTVLLKNFVMENADKDSTPLLSVNNLETSIPIWAILFGGGTVEIKLEAPALSYVETPLSNNWKRAQGLQDTSYNRPEQSVREAAKKIEEVPQKPITLPAILLRTKVNLKVSNLAVNYLLKDKSKGSLLIDKFLVKRLNFSGPTAFELSSLMSSTKDEKVTSVKALVIGEVDLSSYIATMQTRLNLVVTLSEIKLPDPSLKVPEITIDSSFDISPALIAGKTTLKFLEKNQLSLNLEVAKTIKVKDIQGHFFTADLLGIIGKLPGLKVTQNAEVLIHGELLLENGLLTPTLTIETKPEMRVEVASLSIETLLKLSLKDHFLNIVLSNKLLNGSADLIVKGRLNVNDLKNPDILKNLAPLDVRVSSSNIVLSKEFIQSNLSKESEPQAMPVKESNPTIKAEEALFKESVKPIFLPSVNLAFEANRLKVDNELFNAKGVLEVRGNRAVVKSLVFNYAEGTGLLKADATLHPSKTTLSYDFSLKNFDLRGLDPLLPRMVKNLSGKVTTSVKGTASLGKNLAFNAAVTLEAKNGEIKGINFSDYLKPLFAKVPVLAKTPYELDQKFETSSLNGSYSEARYDTKSFVFENKMAKVSGSGSISPLPKEEGSMLFELEDKTGLLSKPLSTIGEKSLPVRLAGRGFALSADYEYTLKRFAKSAIKTKGKEAVQKAVNKYVPPKAQEKVNNLLKGFFK